MTYATTPGSAVTARFSKRFYFTAWRWHFYAGLYVAPFLVMLAVTGLMMLWSSVLVGRDGERSFSVAPAQTEVAVSSLAAAAASAIPGGSVVQYIVPRTPTQPAVFNVTKDKVATMVAVNPYDGSVLGQWERRNALYDLANTIHGTLLIGWVGDRLIEIAAGFAIVLIITGLYLWWPRDGATLRDVLIPQLGLTGRKLWKSLHLTIGFWISAILLIFLLSGLTWAGVWGEKMTQAWSTFPAEKWDNVPLSDETHAHMNHNGIKEVPWTLEQTPMPASGSTAGSAGIPEGTDVNVDSIVAFAHSIGFTGRFQLSFPSGETGVWTISRDTMSNDSANPLDDRTVHIDQYTGKILADVGFFDYGTAGKAMAAGIAFHEGDMGLWNVVFLNLFCLSIIFLSVSGIVMWWKRRPKGAARLFAPTVTEPGPFWKAGALVMLTVSVLFPLTGAVLISVLLIDLFIFSNIPALKRARG